MATQALSQEPVLDPARSGDASTSRSGEAYQSGEGEPQKNGNHSGQAEDNDDPLAIQENDYSQGNGDGIANVIYFNPNFVMSTFF